MDFNVENILKKINIRGQVLLNEPMSRHTSFKIGGPADIYASPLNEEELTAIFRSVRGSGIPVFILGGGANILVSDLGIRGLVVDMGALADIGFHSTRTMVEAGAGARISDVASVAAQHCLSGMEFIFRMPGSVGGAFWMNARCYGRSISELSGWVDYLDGSLDKKRMDISSDLFSYKKSPFQGNSAILLRAAFQLSKGLSENIQAEMTRIEEDRRAKGHFALPSAGSVFKNNRDFGQPTGRILDALGLRGMQKGDAQISPLHANIIVNNGAARAADVRYLIRHARKRAFQEKKIILEPEIRFVGEWTEGEGEE